jgi:hypothetical protein
MDDKGGVDVEFKAPPSLEADSRWQEWKKRLESALRDVVKEARTNPTPGEDRRALTSATKLTVEMREGMGWWAYVFIGNDRNLFAEDKLRAEMYRSGIPVGQGKEP